MYLTGRRFYGKDDEQKVEGYFLMLAAPVIGGTTRPPIYACVRYVRMSQWGQFMMGVARVAGESITLSGTYGHDGLPLWYDEFSEKVKACFTRLPSEESAAYWDGEGGHNSAGSEGPAMQAIGRRLLAQRQAARR